MKSRFYADTNIFIRYLTNDPPDQAEQARRLFEEVSADDFELFINDLVAAEIVYVLESVYELEKDKIVEKLLAIAQLDNVVMENRAVILEALELYKEKNLDFTDAYTASHMKKASCTKICTFDNDFKKLDFIEMVDLRGNI